MRLRISETYTDEKSYRLDGDELVFDRSFGRPHNAVVLPAGWYLTASAIPAAVSQTARRPHPPRLRQPPSRRDRRPDQSEAPSFPSPPGEEGVRAQRVSNALPDTREHPVARLRISNSGSGGLHDTLSRKPRLLSLALPLAGRRGPSR